MSLSHASPGRVRVDADPSCVLAVRVQPRSSKEEVAGVSEGVVRIRLTAPPVEGKANEALLKFLSKKLGIPKGRLELVAGDHGRNKLVRVHGLAGEEVRARLGIVEAPG
jgi:uncharacterized protein (TIGR00251 family)